METIVNAVERIRREYEGSIATNFLTYYDEQYIYPCNWEEFSRYREMHDGQATAPRNWVQRELDALAVETAPFQIPEDFAFFLSYYGGMRLQLDRYDFSIFGIGLVEAGGFESLLQDFGGGSQYQDGWQNIGDLVPSKRDAGIEWNMIDFAMDLSGVVQYGAIFTGGTNASRTWHTPVESLLCVAESFSAWLDRVAAHDWAPFL